MSHSHSNNTRNLTLALSITAAWFVIETAGGFYANSLALLADAAHMLTDLAALGLSLFAMKISTRPATHEMTYGYLRAEILAALANGIFLVLIGLFIFYESYQRFMDPPEIKSVPMLVVAATGLLANLVTAGLLYKSRRENLNLRGAFLHVLGDTLGSIGAIFAGVVILLWQWKLADPIISVVVGGLVIFSSYELVKESVDILLERTPRHLNIPQILSDLGSVKNVVSVHDIHVWAITSAVPAMSCHVVLKTAEDSGATLVILSRLLREKYGIEHTTIQIEYENLAAHSELGIANCE
jgi:cobalt-zinc-cadmium efflux system protein